MPAQFNTLNSKVNTLFEDNLPTYPYATNNFDHGIARHRKCDAKDYKYIQFNAANSIGTMVVDIDKDTYPDDIEPRPHLVVSNKDNAKCHAIYLIKPAVHLNEHSSRKPIVFAESVLKGLTHRLGGDKQYIHQICKNPLNDSFRVFERRLELYDLTELGEWILPSILHDEPSNDLGYGRNCYVFDTCRHWAYKAIRGYLEQPYSAFHDLVLARCVELNVTVYLPMTLQEIKTIARSISKWVWKERFNLTSFSIQAARGRRSAKARQLKMEANKQVALTLLGQGLTITEIAARLSVHRDSVHRWLRGYELS